MQWMSGNNDPTKYDIVATLGPASAQEAIWRGLAAAGATAYRLNTSHLTLEELSTWLERLDAFLASVDADLAVILDLQGSKWRLGRFSPFALREGESVLLRLAPSSEVHAELPVPHADFFLAAHASAADLRLNDGKIHLHVETIHTQSMSARVIKGGKIFPGKGITYAHSDYRLQTLSDKDRAIFARTRALPYIRYAISYIKDPDELAGYRQHVGPGAYLIAKLERQPALAQAGLMTEAADELWLCRGDLGAEIGPRAMAEAVHQFSATVHTLNTPVFLAGQVLEHMTQHNSPTRSELCYLYDALLAGFSGVVLSDETAIGHDPVNACLAAALFRS